MIAGGRGACAALLSVVAVAVLAACTEVSTASNVPVSLQFDSLPSLAVVVGDTLRGDSLIPVRIPVRAYDGSGAAVSDSLLRVIGIDTTSVAAFRVASGLRLIGVKEASAVRVVAQAGSLQSQTQTFAVVPAPTGIVKSNTVNDSIVYDRPDTSLRYADIGVNVIRQVSPDSAAVTLNGLRVRFTVDSFSRAILDSVRLVGTASGKNARSAVVSSGAATLRLKGYAKAGATGTGVVRVLITHANRGAATPGSPVVIIVRLKPFTL